MTELHSDNRNTLMTLRRGLQVIELLSEAGPLGVSELGRRLRLSKTVAHRLLATLEAQGYAAQDPATSKYRLTFRIFMIGASIPQKLGLHDCAQPILERLVAETGETANVGVLDDIYMIYVQKVESPEPLRIGVPVGKRVPAFCTALGKAILAFLPGERAGAIIARTAFTPRTPNTIQSPGILERELLRARAKGFAIDNEEFARGVRCVAAPVLLQGKDPLAAISVSGPASRLSRAEAEEVGLLVKDAAAAISKELEQSRR